MAMEQQSVKEHKETIKKATKALSDRDEKTFKNLHSQDLVAKDFRGEIRGIDDVWDYNMKLFDDMQIQNLEMDEMIAEGDTVAMRWHAGAMQEGNRVRFDMIGMFKFDGDKIKEVHIQGNPAQ